MSVLALAIGPQASAQPTQYGLEKQHVTDLGMVDEYLYVSTTDSGVSARGFLDTLWVNLGLKGKSLRTISVGRLADSGVTILVGASTVGNPFDSVQVYRFHENAWIPADQGLHNSMVDVRSIRTVVTESGQLQVFLVGDSGPIYRLIDSVWSASSSPLSTGFFLQAGEPAAIWCGGASMFEESMLLTSTDMGETWTDVLDPMVFYPGYFSSLAFSPVPTASSILAGSIGAIWVSDQVTWDTVLVTDCHFRAMAAHPFDPYTIFAGGGNQSGFGRLFQSTDGGTNWSEIALPESLKGITALEVTVRDSLELFIATAGDGVYRYTQPSETAALAVRPGWNLISVPRLMTDDSVNELFPSAISPAYKFETGYLTEDTLKNGAGYWVKFGSHQIIPFTGSTFNTDTLDVQPGWTIVGSLSNPLPVDSIRSIPEGIVATEYYGFQEGYAPVSVLVPGKSYWVKVSQAGRIILSK